MASPEFPGTPPIEGPLPWITLQLLGIIHDLDNHRVFPEDPSPLPHLEEVLRALRGYGEQLAAGQPGGQGTGFTTKEARQIAATHVVRVTGLQPYLVTPDRLRSELGDLTATATSAPSQALIQLHTLTYLLSTLTSEPMEFKADLSRVRPLSVAQQLVYRAYRVALVARSEQQSLYRDVVAAAHADVDLPYHLEELAEGHGGVPGLQLGSSSAWMRRPTSQREREQLMTVVESMCRVPQPTERQRGALAYAAAQLVRRWRHEQDVDAVIAAANLRVLLERQGIQ